MRIVVGTIIVIIFFSLDFPYLGPPDWLRDWVHGQMSKGPINFLLIVFVGPVILGGFVAHYVFPIVFLIDDLFRWLKSRL